MATEEQKIDTTTEFITTDKNNLRVDYYSQVDGLTGDADDDIINKIQKCTESADETINNNCAILANDQIGISKKEKIAILNCNQKLQKFKVESKIWEDNLMSADISKTADIYKFREKKKVEIFYPATHEHIS